MYKTVFYQALVMTTDDSEFDNISGLLKLENVESLRSNCLEESIEFLKESKRLNLIIASDTCEKEYCHCHKILEYVKSRNIFVPTIVIVDNAKYVQLDFLESGSFRVFERPLDAAKFLFSCRNFMKYSDAFLKLETAQNIIFAFSRAIEARDTYTQGHSRRVAEFSLGIYDASGLKNIEDREALYVGSLLHDVGKIGVPDSILISPNPLTPSQRKKINKHPAIGYNICKSLSGLTPALDVILYHHEKLDGSGYPEKLIGNKIPLLAQIVTITDIYDAITTKRTYRDLKSAKEAIKIMEEEEVGKINKQFFDIFKHNILYNGVT